MEAIRTALAHLVDAERFDVVEEGGAHALVLEGDEGVVARSRPLTTDDEGRALRDQVVSAAAAQESYDVSFPEEAAVGTALLPFRRELAVDIALLYDFAYASRSGKPGFECFHRADTGQYYFHFNATDGTAILYSRGFESGSRRDGRLRSVIESSKLLQRFERREADGLRFILKARNGQELARSRAFGSEDERSATLGWVHEHAAALGLDLLHRHAGRVAARDQYRLDLRGAGGKPGFEVLRHPEDKLHYFLFNDDEGQALFFGQGYQSKDGRDNGIRSLIRNGVEADRAQIREESGRFYVLLRAANHQALARSRWFDSEAQARAAVLLLAGRLVEWAAVYGVVLQRRAEARVGRLTLSVERTSQAPPSVAEAPLIEQEEPPPVLPIVERVPTPVVETASTPTTPIAREVPAAAPVPGPAPAVVPARAAPAPAPIPAPAPAAVTAPPAHAPVPALVPARTTPGPARAAPAPVVARAHTAPAPAAIPAPAPAEAATVLPAPAPPARVALAPAAVPASARAAPATAVVTVRAAPAPAPPVAAAPAAIPAPAPPVAAAPAAIPAPARREPAPARPVATPPVSREPPALPAPTPEPAPEAPAPKVGEAPPQRAQPAGGVRSRRWLWASAALLLLVVFAAWCGQRSGSVIAGAGRVQPLPSAAGPSVATAPPGVLDGSASDLPCEHDAAAPDPAPAPETDPAPAGAGRAAVGERAGLTFPPGSMEAELVAFLDRSGGALPRVFMMDRLRYRPNSHEVNPEGQEQVIAIARILAAYPTAKIEIRGHRDGAESEVYTGPDPYRSFALSRLRAHCVYRRLHFQKVSEDRMQFEGESAQSPVAGDSTKEGRQQNRRVEIVVVAR